MSEHRSSPSESVLAEGLLFEGKLEGNGSLDDPPCREVPDLR